MNFKMRSNNRIPFLNDPHEIHLDPFTVNGHTYRVIGTQADPHMQNVLNVGTGESRWVSHATVKGWQQIKK